MKLQIKPAASNTLPLYGILIQGKDPAVWAMEIQRLGIRMDACKAFPIPGREAASVWGCLLAFSEKVDPRKAGKHACCQLAGKLLFIPELAELSPALRKEELSELLHDRLHLLHPEIGLYQLEEEVRWADLFETPSLRTQHITTPTEVPEIPKEVHALRIQALPQDEVLEQMEKEAFPQQKRLENRPLSGLEKIKLALYKRLFSKKQRQQQGANATPMSSGSQIGHPSTPVNPVSLLGKILGGMSMGVTTVLGKLFPQFDRWSDQLHEEFENLEQRNQHEADRLLDLFKNDPMEALKYAIPLGDDGLSRGTDQGAFHLSKRWGNDFSALGGGRGTSGTVDLGSHREKLHRQYRETAAELIRQGDHKRAAFIYMKLLRSFQEAAESLEKGRYYQEAASVYLKYCQNEQKAAECYEKGHLLLEAIEQYKALSNHEKVGDLYRKLNRKTEADFHYAIVATDYIKKDQVVRASLIYRNKMDQAEEAQKILLEGWKKQKDPFSCLNNYFNNISKTDELGREIQRIYREDVHKKNQLVFLQALRHEYERENELQRDVRELAYAIISSASKSKPSIVSELLAFNAPDKNLQRDAFRFKNKRT